MSLGKILVITALSLASIIGVALFLKEDSSERSADTTIAKATAIKPDVIHKPTETPVEIPLDSEVKIVIPEPPPPPPTPPPVQNIPTPTPSKQESKPIIPEVDRIEELFSTTGKKLPFIETVTYKSRVSWQKGRPAWLSDYASHYATSRHFIARSLNGNRDYFKQEVAEGNKFNVYKIDHPLEFQLVIDTTQVKAWLFALHGSGKEKTLLKTYKVSLGRRDASKESGLLTPLGKYKLGSRIAIYKPKVMGHHKGEKAEMIQLFGTRWIPFEIAMGETTVPAKGFGIHGVPWSKNKKGELEEDLSCLGKFESDGCVRLAAADIEEIYAIIITKPAYVELVSDISQSELYSD